MRKSLLTVCLLSAVSLTVYAQKREKYEFKRNLPVYAEHKGTVPECIEIGDVSLEDRLCFRAANTCVHFLCQGGRHGFLKIS